MCIAARTCVDPVPLPLVQCAGLFYRNDDNEHPYRRSVNATGFSQLISVV